MACLNMVLFVFLPVKRKNSKKDLVFLNLKNLFKFFTLRVYERKPCIRP